MRLPRLLKPDGLGHSGPDPCFAAPSALGVFLVVVLASDLFDGLHQLAGRPVQLPGALGQRQQRRRPITAPGLHGDRHITIGAARLQNGGCPLGRRRKPQLTAKFHAL